MPASFVEEIAALTPRLHAFSYRLCADRSQAEDLVQETVLRALVHANQFRPGTSLGAWLFTILRNCFFNDCRAAKKFIPMDELPVSSIATIDNPQEAHVALREAATRIDALPCPQRQALILIAVDGYTYDSAAKQVGCAVGTMKSRVSRARQEIKDDSRDAPSATRSGRGGLRPAAWR